VWSHEDRGYDCAVAQAVPETTEYVARVAEDLLADADAMLEEMNAAIFQTSPVLSGDATIEAETIASTRANMLRWLRAMASHPGQPVPEGLPPEALDLARSLVRRGIELDALLHAYRRGQNVAWRRWMETAAATVPQGPELIELLDVSSELMFSYVDQVIGGVLGQVQREREDLVGGALARRTATVRLILDGAPVDRDSAGAQLGYELARRHTAMVLWTEPPGLVQGALERAASALARAAGAGRPLTIPAGTSALWAWIGTADADPDPRALRAALASAEPNVRAVTGPTRGGITGFRRSHAAAIAAQRLVAGGDGERLTTHREVEVVALAGQDAEQVAEFVASVLGPLGAPGDPAVARLRETVRVWLDEGEHAPRTAERLNTHRNTVLHRVARAEELIGHPIAERRLAVALALELAARMGSRALGRNAARFAEFAP
jgi:DNA-binding PucR family transcriptional regulator